jgi:hypothetical protein
MLGLGGMAWAAMMTGIAWGSGREPGTEARRHEGTKGGELFAACGGVVAALVVQFLVELGVLGGVFVLIAGVLAIPIGLAGWITWKERKPVAGAFVTLATIAGGFWMLPRLGCWLASLVGAALVTGAGTALLLPLVRHEAAMARAAQAMRVGDNGDLPAAIAWLRDAQQADPGDPKAWAEEARVALLTGGSPSERLQSIAAALKTLDDGIARNPGSSLLRRVRLTLLTERWKITRDPAAGNATLEAAKQWLAKEPKGIAPHVEAADLAWEIGDREQARRWYARALQLSDLSYLDPNKQLAGETLARVKARAGR